MGLLSRAVGIRNFSLEDPAQPLLPMSALFESLGLGRSHSGVMVNEKQSLRSSPIFCAAKILSEDLSKIQLSVFRRLPDDSIRLARQHPVHRILHDEGNPIMTAAVWRAAWITSAWLWGNGFVFINRDNGARPVSVHPLPSNRTSAVVIDGEFMFATTATPNGQVKYVAPENMLHLIGLSLDGMHGMSPITTCQDVAGLALAAEKYAAQFFGNGARATGVFSHPGSLLPEAYENLKKSVREIMTGENALRPLLLEEGLKWNQISVNPDEGQMKETRTFQISEVGRLSRIPAHKLGELSRSTNNNIEHQGIEHLQDALQPTAVKVEQEVNRKLLGGSFFCEHDFSELSRGDQVALSTSLSSLRNVGLISTDEGRGKLRLNPLGEEHGGNVYTVQGAMIPLSSLTDKNWAAEKAATAAAQKSPMRRGATPGSDEGDDSEIPAALGPGIQAAFRRIFRDAVGRIANRKTFDSLYAYRTLQPVIAGVAETFVMEKHGFSRLNEQDHENITFWAKKLVKSAADWTLANANEIADGITEETFTYAEATF